MTDHCEHCGAPKGRQRSRKQHNRLFGLAAAARHHWPETHWFQPKSDDHMRYWLTVRAGKFEVVRTIRVHSVETAALQALLDSVLRASSDEHLFLDVDGDLITVQRAISVKTTGPNAMPQHEFSKLCDEVDNVLKAEGFDPAQLLRETASAA